MKISKLVFTAAISLLTINLASANIGNTVNTKNGKIEGYLSADKQLSIFKGIPFAEPPVDELRWQKPQEIKKWHNVKETKTFSAGCMQTVIDGDKLPWSKEFLHQGPISEDCLYLNVWSPANHKNDKLPVMIWIYGGGFIEGSANVPLYDGANLASNGVVFVTFNYRVGAFGFFEHPELTKEQGTSGNYGLYDQLAAIKWVKQNIAEFGGDPNNITIMGQSAGANSITALIASPLSKGLFQKAIIESGPGTTISDYGIRPLQKAATPLKDAEKLVLNWSQNNGYSSLEALRAAPADELMNKFNKKPPVKGYVIDGVFLPESIPAIYAKGEQNEVPVIAGMNRDERGSEKDYGKMTLKEYQSYAEKYYPYNKQQFLLTYPAQNNQEAGEQQKQILRDERLFNLYWLANARMSKNNAKNYLYYFDRAIPWPEHPEYGAFHSSEFVYVLQNQDKLARNWTPLDQKISSVIGQYWVNFAKTGNPNGGDLPDWKPINESNGEVMVFGNEIEMKKVLSNKKSVIIAEKVN
ncbi:carboxylesterase/lipase family protein [Orbus mooreae]|uniref:carboxylesterase/lipase family protein n=1 Tax=Orbus mooreae TaxID=3074107 RepID=UPI00370D8700